MNILTTIKQDWQNNWGGLLGTMGLFIMVGLISYNAGITNGQVQLCASDNATLVEHKSGERYCEYNFIAPKDYYDTNYDILLNNSMDLGGFEYGIQS